ncbi:hypothetical protein DQ04_03091030 [Trypanosoma grayi]|uniref:hypothetical protein n=1 Tax=Trypanosoma grayi TaxID=71804 RepID=UPI0004F4526A|nr:hypothetical protein DQ04_03091030 [Trypanosoma grayi]KEG10977.1 hypothetical protein DQ04_03091030 [Trypanosoma grayi]
MPQQQSVESFKRISFMADGQARITEGSSRRLLPVRSSEPFSDDAGLPMPAALFSYSRIIVSKSRDAAAAAAEAEAGHAPQMRTVARHVPSFCPPERNHCGAAVSHNATLVLSTMKPVCSRMSFSVLLHVYDLSNGLLHRHSEELLGIYASGVCHSSVVCYGMEFFFEGGIDVACAGCTRFGKNFDKVDLGTTTKTLSEFMAWIHQHREEYQLNLYHPTQHNCHHFTREASTFLIGKEGAHPSHLNDTVKTLISTKIGAGVDELLFRFIRGVQWVIAKTQRDRMLERQRSAMTIARCARAYGVDAQPPRSVVLFRVDSALKSRQALEALMPYVEQLKQRGVLDKPWRGAMQFFATLSEGGEVIDPKLALEYVETVACVLMHTHVTLWGPILNGLRVAILHKTVLCNCVFHPRLIGILGGGVRDFLSMTADGKLALLRVLCNLSSGVHGAVVLNCRAFSELWVSAVGLALMDHRNTAIVYTGAALAVNLTHSFMLTTNSLLARLYDDVAVRGHPVRALLTVLLFHLRHWPPERVTEAALNMVLLALFFLLSSCEAAVDAAAEHPFRLNYMDLLKRARTNESKALICLLHGLQHL